MLLNNCERYFVQNISLKIIFIFYFIITSNFICVVRSCQRTYTKFGNGGKNILYDIKEIENFPTTIDFFENFVRPSKPLKMSKAATNFPAFNLWVADEYLLNIAANQESVVSVETVKKENRKQEVFRMSFTEFMHLYNHTQHYLVDKVPDFLL